MTRYPCPVCGRAIASTDGHVYSSVPDADGRWFPYMYLRRHVKAPGVRCEGMAVRVVGREPQPASTVRE